MTVPHYGKRNAGALTAASPGDTLFFNFGSYNDSGDSEALTGLTVADIEVFKNGSATARATDSGYSLISDTGQIGDRVGLYRFSISLFNTADDTGHYESGAWYQVAVDSVTIDGKTVRFWAGSFEIGEPRANLVQIGGDTGFADRLGKLASLLSATGQIDTGTIAGGFIAANVRQIDSDTGAASQLRQAFATTPAYFQQVDVQRVDGDTGAATRFFRFLEKLDTGGDLSVSASVDTGQVNQAVWQANAARSITASSDTGVNDRLARIQSDVDTGLRTHISDVDTGLHDIIADLDTGLRGILITTGVNLGLIRGDTGGADRFYRYTQKLDTGGDATVSASVDTGQVNQAVWQGNATRVLTANTNLANLAVNVTQLDSDTGFAAQLGKFASVLSDAGLIDTGTGAADTGRLNTTVWDGTRAAHLVSGTFGQYVNANVDRVEGDTGASTRLFRFLEKLDTGGDLSVSAGVDTGAVNQAVWQANAARGITAIADTGMNERFGRIQSDVDTGLRTHINDLDTGLHDTLSDYDTGVRGILITTGVNLGRIRGDTGGADRFFRYTQKLDTGGDATVSASVDTGLVNQAVWQANAQRKLTVDTGIADQVWKQPTTAYADDTGTFGELLRVAISSSASVDTGQINQAVWQGNATRSITNVGDTGIVNSLQIIRFDVDTGLRTHIDDLDTGLHAHISDVDTGLHDTIADLDTGLRPLLASQDTGAVAAAVWGFSSRPVTNVTGISDTGVNQRLEAIQTKTDSLTFTVAGVVDSNIQRVNDVAITGTGDTGTADTWRPA